MRKASPIKLFLSQKKIYSASATGCENSRLRIRADHTLRTISCDSLESAVFLKIWNDVSCYHVFCYGMYNAYVTVIWTVNNHGQSGLFFLLMSPILTLRARLILDFEGVKLPDKTDRISLNSSRIMSIPLINRTFQGCAAY